MCLCRWIQHSFQYLSGDFSLAASNGGIIWKFRSANCLRISRPLKQLLKVSAVPISRIAVWKFFCKLLSNYLWRSLYIVKFHDFSIFFWTPLEGFVWSMRIILWDASYFRHSNNIHTARASLQNLLMELQWKWRLQVLIRQQRTKMNVSTCFSIKYAHWRWFCAPVFLRARSGAQVKLRARKIGRVEVNFSSPDNVFCFNSFFCEFAIF